MYGTSFVSPSTDKENALVIILQVDFFFLQFWSKTQNKKKSSLLASPVKLVCDQYRKLVTLSITKPTNLSITSVLFFVCSGLLLLLLINTWSDRHTTIR